MAKLYAQKINNNEINALTGEGVETWKMCRCCGGLRLRLLRNQQDESCH